MGEGEGKGERQVGGGVVTCYGFVVMRRSTCNRAAVLHFTLLRVELHSGSVSPMTLRLADRFGMRRLKTPLPFLP